MSDFKFNENVAGGSNSVPDIPKFPEGLRVIAVDDDRVSLRTVTVMLEKCKYQGSIFTLISYLLLTCLSEKTVFLVVMRICVMCVCMQMVVLLRIK